MLDKLLDLILIEMHTYEAFWGVQPMYVLLGIEEMTIIDIEFVTIHNKPTIATIFGMYVVPVHDSYNHIGVS